MPEQDDETIIEEINNIDNNKKSPASLAYKNPLNRRFEIDSKICSMSDIPCQEKRRPAPVISEEAEEESAMRRLANNIDKTRRSSLKYFFPKVSHYISNSATRKQKVCAEQRNENSAKRVKTEIAVENEQKIDGLIENMSHFRRKQETPARSSSPFQPKTSPIETLSTPSKLRHMKVNEKDLKKRMEHNDDQLSSPTRRSCSPDSVQSGYVARSPLHRNAIDDLPSTSHDISHNSLPEANSSKEGRGYVMDDPNLEQESEEAEEDLNPSFEEFSPKKPKKINTAPLLKSGIDALNAALAKDYVILPDLYRREETDCCMIDVDSLSPKNPGPPKPNPPRASPNETFYGKRGYVDFWWSDDFVSEDGIKLGMVRKRELRIAVREGFENLDQFKTLMIRMRVMERIDGLEYIYKKLDDDKLRKSTLKLLHQIVILASRTPELITKPLQILRTNSELMKCSVSLSQEQCASILASCFLGLMPVPRNCDYFNVLSLEAFLHFRDEISLQKLHFMLNYFTKVTNEMPVGMVTFRRVSHRLSDIQPISEKFKDTKLSQIYLVNKPIEKCHNALQVDFANQFIGGGVIGHGFVQEEIRFLCSPEMMISMLICPRMRSNEAIFIAGAQEFSGYEGYASKTRMKYLPTDCFRPARDKFRRFMSEIVAIDATQFGRYNRAVQFKHGCINREIMKAFSGFNTPLKEKPPVATGNWGCGAFCGDLELKCVIQLIAASMAGRELLYSAFDQEQKIAEFCLLVEKMTNQGWDLEELYTHLMKYRKGGELSLFEFLSSYLAPV